MQTVLERFLSYVKVDTQSEDGVEEVPSTKKQFDLARLLAEELSRLGAQDVAVSEHCYVSARIPATDEKKRPVLGLIAHMDTSDAVSGANVNPVTTHDYDGGDIEMSQGYTLLPEEYPALKNYVGKTLICTDGTTLLGADDKAGVAEIMTLVERLLKEKPFPHGEIRVCFTPDEEVGRGVDCFDVAAFGADYAFTVDGGALGEINCENFNAAEAKISVSGMSIHPGSARGKMVNAMLVCMELNDMLPRFMNPACTSDYEGFFHLERMSGRVDHAEMQYIIRDHDAALFQKKKALMQAAVSYLNEKYGAGTVNLALRDSYFNMREKIDESLVQKAKDAMLACGVEPRVEPIRGGTDGSRLSYMGLPCPNLCTGGHNFHGRYEFICVESMETVVDILTEIVKNA